jgi:putative transposase
MAAEGLPVQLACRLLVVANFKRNGGVRGHRRTIRHAWLSDQIRVVHAASRGSYGARRVHADLTLGVGRQVGHKVETLMARAGIEGLAW